MEQGLLGSLEVSLKELIRDGKQSEEGTYELVAEFDMVGVVDLPDKKKVPPAKTRSSNHSVHKRPTGTEPVGSLHATTE